MYIYVCINVYVCMCEPLYTWTKPGRVTTIVLAGCQGATYLNMSQIMVTIRTPDVYLDEINLLNLKDVKTFEFD